MENNRNNRKKKKRPEITIMTLLACEKPKESTELLQKNGKGRAKNYKDLERKLTELYFDPNSDKAQMEKELANIHPHKDWFLRVMAPEIEAKKEVVVEPDPPGKQVKVDPATIKRIELLEQRSDFFGVPQSESPKVNEEKVADKLIIVGMVTIVAMFGLAVITNLKTR